MNKCRRAEKKKKDYGIRHRSLGIETANWLLLSTIAISRVINVFCSDSPSCNSQREIRELDDTCTCNGLHYIRRILS
jgi:hypothetical protein